MLGMSRMIEHRMLIRDVLRQSVSQFAAVKQK